MKKLVVVWSVLLICRAALIGGLITPGCQEPPTLPADKISASPKIWWNSSTMDFAHQPRGGRGKGGFCVYTLPGGSGPF